MQKTSRQFSCKSNNPAHQQNNKLTKADGGGIGILDNAIALLRWMISGPIVVSLINNYETSNCFILKHHENNDSLEQTFQSNVLSLVRQYKERKGILLRRRIMFFIQILVKTLSEERLVPVQKAADAGSFVRDVIEYGTKSIYYTIKKNNLHLFKKGSVNLMSKSKEKIVALKQDGKLYVSLYVACQVICLTSFHMKTTLTIQLNPPLGC